MYTKVHLEGNQWLRDNGTIVGKTVESYFNMYYSGKTPIIITSKGQYVKPVYGRINPKTKEFVPMCEGINANLCCGQFCKAFMENPYICPCHKVDSTVGYYIFSN